MFRVVRSADDLIKAMIVRGIVFMEEQAVSYAEEVDAEEYGAVHILGEIDGEPMAAARIRFLGEYAKMERVAIRAKYRGHGYGHRLLEFMMETAQTRGFSKFKMHAQAHLKGFYQAHGFEARGEIFQEAGIDHYLMVRETGYSDVNP